MKMKNFILISLMFVTLGFACSPSPKKIDYKISTFGESGWITICITSGNNITIMSYANQNDYYKSGNPFYILQGTIGVPDKKNIEFGDGNPTAGPVQFKCLWVDPGNEDSVPNIGTVWYKSNPNGKDQLEIINDEDGLNIEIAN